MWFNIQKIQKIQHCTALSLSPRLMLSDRRSEWSGGAGLSCHLLLDLDTFSASSTNTHSQHNQQSQLSIAQTLNWRISTHLHTVTASTMALDSVVLGVLVLASTGLASHGDSVLAAVLGAKQVPGLGCLTCRYTGRSIKDDTNVSLCLIGCGCLLVVFSLSFKVLKWRAFL